MDLRWIHCGTRPTGTFPRIVFPARINPTRTPGRPRRFPSDSWNKKIPPHVRRGIPFCESMCESPSNATPRQRARRILRQMHTVTSRSATLTGIILPVVLMFVGAYFTFTAVQGNHGLFQRVQIQAEADRLADVHADLQAEVSRMEVLTLRLSDDYLDLDLLDEQARDVLGYVRADEVVLP